MSSFITRIELHSASYSDYENLHREMGKQGFSRTIKSDDGITWQLPTAEYEINSNQKCSDIRQKAAIAATATGKSFAVLVTEAREICWRGLARA